MTKSCVLLFLLCATLGYHATDSVPIVPNAAGAMAAGVLSFSLMTSGTKAGDCARVAGQRLSELLNVATSLERDVFLVRKASTVSGVIVARLLVFDRKHRIRDGVGKLLDKVWRRLAGGEQEEERRGFDNDNYGRR